MHFLSVLHVDPLSKVHLNTIASFFISLLSSPFDCFHLLRVLSLELLSLIRTSCCVLITASVLLCGPSAAALTLSQFCPSSKGRKSHFPNFPRFASLWGDLLFFSSFLFLFALLHPHRKQTCDDLFALFPPSPVSELRLFFFSLSSSFSASLSSMFSELATSPSGASAFPVLVSFPWLFLSRILRSLPWLFY